MKFGIFQTVQWPEGSDQRQQYRNAIEQSVFAEELGFHSVWMTEHHFTRHGITSDSLALLSHIAALTERIRLGTAVSVLPFHDPVRLAESTALVDQLSDGRLDVGVGRGYQWSEYLGFGVPWDEGGERFEECLDILLKSWTATEPFEYRGKFHSYPQAFPQPKPAQSPHPALWHATGSDDGFRRCAENGWGVLLPQAVQVPDLARTVDRYRTQCAAVHADFESAKVVLARGMYCAQTNDEAWDTFAPAYTDMLQLADRVSAPPASSGAKPRAPFQLASGPTLVAGSVCGDPDWCAASVQALADIGVGQVILFVNPGGMEHSKVLESLRLFAREVMPRFADDSSTGSAAERL